MAVTSAARRTVRVLAMAWALVFAWFVQAAEPGARIADPPIQFAPNAMLRAEFLDKANPALPQFALGGLPPERMIRETGLDFLFYRRFRDNQMGGPDPVLRDALAGEYARGDLKLLPIVEDRPVVLAIAAPFANTREAWRWPQTAFLADHTIVVTVEDPGPADAAAEAKNISRQDVYLMMLPPLLAGQYKLRSVILQRMRPEEGKEKPSVALRITEVPFEVGKSGEADRPAAPPPKIVDATIAPVQKAPDELTQWTDQPLWFATARKADHRIEPPDRKYGLSVGRCLSKEGKTDPFPLMRGTMSDLLGVENLPPLAPPVASEHTYAMVVLPSVNSGEWASLRRVRWQGNHGVIEVDEWTDNGARFDNWLAHPVLLIDLTPPVPGKPGEIMPQGHYTLDLAVHRLLAKDQHGQWYVEQPNEELMKSLVHHVEFDVKE